MDNLLSDHRDSCATQSFGPWAACDCGCEESRARFRRGQKCRIERLLLDPAHAPVLADLLIAEGEPPLTDAGVEEALAVLQVGRREDRRRELAAAYARGELAPEERAELAALLREED